MDRGPWFDAHNVRRKGTPGKPTRATDAGRTTSRGFIHSRTAMMRAVVSVLRWIGRACNWLQWAKHYFIFPPNENDAEEMLLYNERTKW